MRTAFIVTLLTALSACASWPEALWPGRAPSEPAAVSATELVLSGTSGAPAPGFPQYWQRNTLVIDMQNAGREGDFVVAPRPGGSWPVRLAFRVRPGGFGALEVRGEQRLLLPIAPGGASLVDLELAPGTYTQATERLSVSWRPAPTPADQSPGG